MATHFDLEARHHRQVADTLIDTTQEILARNDVAERLGEDYADHLLRLVLGAGIIALKGFEPTEHPGYSKPSENGLYIVPVNKGLRRGATYELDLNGHKHRYDVRLPKSTGMFCTTDLSALDINLIVVPAAHGLDLVDQAAGASHELTHVLQFRRGALGTQKHQKISVARSTMSEAEAYETCFDVADVCVDGQLTQIVDQAILDNMTVDFTLTQNQIKTNVARCLGRSWPKAVSAQAHAANQLANYYADGVTRPPKGLIDRYILMQIL